MKNSISVKNIVTKYTQLRRKESFDSLSLAYVYKVVTNNVDSLHVRIKKHEKQSFAFKI